MGLDKCVHLGAYLECKKTEGVDYDYYDSNDRLYRVECYYKEDVDIDIFLPNKRNSGTVDFSEDGCACPVDKKMIAKHCALFSDFYRDDIVALDKIYGNKNIELKFGLVIHWM